MNSFRLRSMVLLAALGLWGGHLPMSRADEPALKLTTRAKIATIDPQTNQVKLRTEEDKPLTVIVDNQTKIRVSDREVRLADLREGLEVAVVYQTINGKNMASALTVASTAEPPPPPTESPTKGTVAVIRAPKQTKITGTVVKVLQASNSFLVRMPDGHEDMFYFDNTASAADLEEGATVTVVYQVRNVVSSVALNSTDGTTTAAPRRSEVIPQEETAAGFLNFEGDIVRVAPEEGFVILKSRDGKERRFFTQKSSTFMMDQKRAQLNDFQVGSPVSVRFKSVEGRDMISNFNSMPATPAPPKPVPAKVRPR